MGDAIAIALSIKAKAAEAEATTTGATDPKDYVFTGKTSCLKQNIVLFAVLISRTISALHDAKAGTFKVSRSPLEAASSHLMQTIAIEIEAKATAIFAKQQITQADRTFLMSAFKASSIDEASEAIINQLYEAIAAGKVRVVA